MVNRKEFAPSYDQNEYQNTKPSEFSARRYRPPVLDQQSNSKSSDSDRDFYRPGLGFSPAEGQSSNFESNNDTKSSKYLKPVKFTRAKEQRYLYMDTVTNTNTTSSEPVKSTTAPDKTKDTITSIKQESQNTNRTPSTAGKKKSSARNVDKKQIKNSATTFNEKAATQSKDLQESSHDQSEQDRIVVEDFEYGNTVDVDALERLLRNTKIENETSIDHPSDKSADKKDILEKPSPTLNNDLITENDSDRDVSDSEKEGQYVYQREIEKRQKKEIRDKEKAQKKAYTNEGSSHYQNPHIQYQQPQYNHSHSQYPQYEPHLYSQYSQYQYSQPEYPQSEYSQYQYPQYQYPQSQYPQSQYPQPQYPQPQYPEQYYNTYYGYHQHMTEKETEKQRKKRLRDLIKAGKKAQRTGIKEQASTYVDPKDQEELEKLEIHEDRKAEKKAQRKQERDVKKMEVSQDPAFVKLMMDIDEKMQAFINDDGAERYEFEPIPVEARRHLHVIAALYGLKSKSYGSPTERRNVLTKTDLTNLPENRQRIERHIFTAPDTKSLNKLIGKLNAKNKPQKEVAAGVLPLDEDNVGHRMLSAMGWKEGDSLGTGEGGITAPIRTVIRQNRKGLGS